MSVQRARTVTVGREPVSGRAPGTRAATGVLSDFLELILHVEHEAGEVLGSSPAPGSRLPVPVLSQSHNMGRGQHA